MVRTACPGRPLATLELRVLLRTVLAGHRVRLDPDSEPTREQPPVGGYRHVHAYSTLAEAMLQRRVPLERAPGSCHRTAGTSGNESGKCGYAALHHTSCEAIALHASC